MKILLTIALVFFFAIFAKSQDAAFYDALNAQPNLYQPILPAPMTPFVFPAPAPAKSEHFTQCCQVRYETERGWSDYYKVQVQFETGGYLNEKTRNMITWAKLIMPSYSGLRASVPSSSSADTFPFSFLTYQPLRKTSATIRVTGNGGYSLFRVINIFYL